MTVTVETPSGKLAGNEIDGVRTFLGIPFAKPPVGALRYAAPEPIEPWAGERQAVAFGGSALQAAMVIPLPGMEVGRQDEDCLYLNVFAPAGGAAKKPVLVWIHGGGFVIGSGSQEIYDGARLAKRGDVVVVTINYRLGALGFLHLDDVCPMPGAVSNPGMRDQIAALDWVRSHIGAFGGDPGNVTIFGESAGGMSVGTLLGMPKANGLLRARDPAERRGPPRPHARSRVEGDRGLPRRPRHRPQGRAARAPRDARAEARRRADAAPGAARRLARSAAVPARGRRRLAARPAAPGGARRRVHGRVAPRRLDARRVEALRR